MIRLALALMFLAASAAQAAEEQYPVLVYPCPRALAAPAIDGRLDEPAWEKAPRVSGFTFYNKHELAPVQTSFRATYDDRALYLGVECDEPEGKRLTLGTADNHDSHASVFAGECIEVFVDPLHEHTGYYQIAAGLGGSIYDGRGGDATWNSRTQARCSLREDGWCLEMAIPWADLEVKPRPGMVVGFNVCRDRNVGDRQWTTWSQIAANFHDPMHFGHLVLSPTPEMLGKLGEELHTGGASGPIRIFGAEGFTGTTYLALAAQALAGVSARLADLEALRRGERSPAVAAGLDQRILRARETLAPIAAQVKAGKPLDSAEWVRTDLALQSLSESLGKALWDARLEGLLAGI